MSDKERFFGFAAMDVVRSYDIRSLDLSKDDLMDIYSRNPEYDFIILFLKRIHPDILDVIARNGDDRIKGLVCHKYPLLVETYNFLLQQDESVRLDLCGNKNLPAHVIRSLLKRQVETCSEKNERYF